MDEYFGDGLHPPSPGEKRPLGQELLHLIRHNENHPEDLDNFEQVVDRLQSLISHTGRQGGLFHGQEDDAQKVLDAASSQSSRGKSSKSDGPSSKGPAVDGQLTISALLRILETKGNPLLTALAADFLDTICTSISGDDLRSLASFEVLASSGKQLLEGLKSSGVHFEAEDSEESKKAREACLHAAAGLVVLFGNRLARSTQLLESLLEWAWNTMFFSSESASTLAAAHLLIAIPVRPSLGGVISCLSSVLKRSVPMIHLTSPDEQAGEAMSDHMSHALEKWFEQMSHRSNQRNLVDIFLGVVHGLVSAIILSMEAVVDGRIVSVDVESVLLVVESLISFPLTAETTFHGTKKRLREECTNGGLFNPLQLVRQVANSLFLEGINLLEALLTAAPTQSYCRRTFRICNAAIRTTCSSTVRQVIDPSSSLQFTGSRQRWLHRSLRGRSAAFRSFRTALLIFGTDPQRIAFEHRGRESADDVERSIQMVAGSFLEALSGDHFASDAWGTRMEHISMLVEASSCLTCSLRVGGEFLSINVRNILESTAHRGLSSMVMGAYQNDVSLRCSCLALASACLETPWNDGSASALASQALIIAKQIYQQQEQEDARTLESAYSLARLIEVSLFPRIPALSVTKHVSLDDSFQTELAKSQQSAKDQRAMLKHFNMMKPSSADVGDAEEITQAKRPVPSHASEIEDIQVKVKKSKIHVEHGKASEDNLCIEEEKVEHQDETKLASYHHQKTKLTSNQDENKVTSNQDENKNRDVKSSKFTPESRVASEGSLPIQAIVDDNDNTDGSDEEDDFPVIIDCEPDDHDFETPNH